MRESIARATATAGGAVVFAGGTVVIALVSLLAVGHPARGHDGLLRRRVGGGRGARRHHAAARPARRARLPHQLAAREAGPHPSGRPPAARLGPLGARCGGAPLALGDRRHRDPRRAGGARAEPRARIVRRRRAAREHHRTPGLRRDHRGLRRRRERPAAHRREARPGRQAGPEAAQPGQPAGAEAQGAAAAAGGAAGGARGCPQSQAQQQVQQQTASQQQQARPAEEARLLAVHRHAAHRPRERDQEDAGREVGVAGDASTRPAPRGCSRPCPPRPRRTRRPRT